LNTLKIFIGIPASDSSQDAKLSAILYAADQVVKKYCKRLFETAQYVWYPPEPRLGGEAIVVEETPILCYLSTGTITSGQATITGLPDTSKLLVGMTATVAAQSNQTVQPFPNAATIVSIDSSSQVTMSGNATANVPNVPILFGFSMWFDPNGSFGMGPGTNPGGPYQAPQLLLQGIDYALQRDQPDGTSGSGKVIRLASVFGFLGMGGAWNPYGSTWGGLNERSTLSAPLKPLWPTWPPGSFKIMYAAGLGVGAAAPTATNPNGGNLPTNTTIPYDLTTAVNGVASWMWNNASTGLLQVTSESFQGYSMAIRPAMDALKSSPELGSTRQILSRYRRLAM